jgi:hypothetical protein
MAEDMKLDDLSDVKKIVFIDNSPQVSDEAFLLFCRALNKRRPWTSKDSIPVPFIDDMNQNIR